MLEPLFNKVAGLAASTQMFSCEYCEISKNIILKNMCERLFLYFWYSVSVLYGENTAFVIVLCCYACYLLSV